MEDDLFDIIGFSLFETEEVWCFLKNIPCISFKSCDAHPEEVGCPHKYNEQDDICANPIRGTMSKGIKGRA
jgi:hypothetical protein